MHAVKAVRFLPLGRGGEVPGERRQRHTPILPSTNLVAWVWAVLVGGLSWSFLRAGYVCTGVQSAPGSRGEGRPVKLEEGTTGRIRTEASKPVDGSTTKLEGAGGDQ